VRRLGGAKTFLAQSSAAFRNDCLSKKALLAAPSVGMPVERVNAFAGRLKQKVEYDLSRGCTSSWQFVFQHRALRINQQPHHHAKRKDPGHHIKRPRPGIEALAGIASAPSESKKVWRCVNIAHAQQ
jgi:hypothetical protein